MGSAVSIEEEEATEGARVLSDATKEAEKMVTSCTAETEAVLREALESGISEAVPSLSVLALIPEAQKTAASALLSKVLLTNKQLEEVGALVGDGWGAIAGSGVLVALGSALGQVTGMAPEVVHAVGECLGFLGAHLGPLAAAAGFLGALVYAFELTKDQEKNVKTVILWSASVKDWILMVAGRVELSHAESTLPLFEGLRAEMESMYRQIDKRHKNSWRIGKMLSSSMFQRDFQRAKNSVLELKGALKDFLDQEATDLQESLLRTVNSATLDIVNKIDTMDEQLKEIRHLLLKQTDKKLCLDLDEETHIYLAIQNMAHKNPTDEPVSFKDFAIAFECFFLSGKDLSADAKRGLKFAVSSNDGRVSKLAFAKFFRRWKHDNLPMDDFVNKLALEAPPTVYKQVKTGVHKVLTSSEAKRANQAANHAASQASSIGTNLAKTAANTFLPTTANYFNTKKIKNNDEITTTTPEKQQQDQQEVLSVAASD